MFRKHWVLRQAIDWRVVIPGRERVREGAWDQLSLF